MLGWKENALQRTASLLLQLHCMEQLKLQVIGKFDKPRCLKNIVLMLCDYRAKKKAPMMRELFMQLLLPPDDAMTRKQNYHR